jgi:hypothetical protein
MIEFQLIKKNIKINTFILIGEIQNISLLNKIKNQINEKFKEKNELDYKTHVGGLFTGFDFLVRNSDFHLIIKSIQEEIKIIYPYDFVIRDAWANLLKKGGKVTPHLHADVTAFCGIIYLNESGPGTYFSEYDLLVNEKFGKFVIFNPLLKHEVKEMHDDIERITIAFNMNQVKSFENKSIMKKIN